MTKVEAGRILRRFRDEAEYEPTEEEWAVVDKATEDRMAELWRRGWRPTSCGCCAGLQWGGEEPRECLNCDGSGGVWASPKGRLAHYPGGPFNGGQLDAAELAALQAVVATPVKAALP